MAERPRERLELRGSAGLTSAELIGLLWGTGGRGRSAVDLAEDAIARVAARAPACDEQFHRLPLSVAKWRIRYS